MQSADEHVRRLNLPGGKAHPVISTHLQLLTLPLCWHLATPPSLLQPLLIISSIHLMSSITPSLRIRTSRVACYIAQNSSFALTGAGSELKVVNRVKGHGGFS